MLKPDGAHIHHRLLKMGFSQRQAVVFLYTVTSILCILAVTIVSADIWKFIILIFAVDWKMAVIMILHPQLTTKPTP